MLEEIAPLVGTALEITIYGTCSDRRPRTKIFAKAPSPPEASVPQKPSLSSPNLVSEFFLPDSTTHDIISFAKVCYSTNSQYLKLDYGSLRLFELDLARCTDICAPASPALFTSLRHLCIYRKHGRRSTAGPYLQARACR